MKNKKLLFIVFALLVLSALAHGFNMFHFPYYENDEGAYMAQAWALLNKGALAPYTYWYDHAPFGWIMVAAWTLISGGFYTFGLSVNSGRVLMLLLHIISTFLVIFITKRLSKSTYAAIIAAVVFALTPIGLYFHRRVLLDNMMVFWVLLAFALLLVKRVKLLHIFLSAIALGLAVLTKENAVFFAPGLLFTIWTRTKASQRRFALVSWVVTVGCLVSLYIVYAFLKNELFPVGSPLGGDSPHVSLLTTLKFQAARQGGSIFEDSPESIGRNIRLWITQDPLIMLGGIASMVWMMIGIFAKRLRPYLGLGIITWGFMYFLNRGGVVIEFYIVPLLPFLSIGIGCVVSEIRSAFFRLLSPRLLPAVSFISIIVLLTWYVSFAQISRSFAQLSTGHSIFFSDQTTSQKNAVEWIRTHVKPDEVIVIDNYAYVDLQDPRNPSGKVFPNAEWYWKVDLDPEVRTDVMKDSAETIHYVAATPQLLADLSKGSSPLTAESITHGRVIKSFIDYGWGVTLYRSLYPTHMLQRSWDSYKQHFMIDGKTIDPQTEITTSEGQSYSLLRAVWMNDRDVFDIVWNWTKLNLQQSSGTFAWKLTDAGNATDADTDIALALAFAAKRWNDGPYLAESRQVIRGIWDKEVAIMNNKPYLTAGDWARQETGAVVNPSYFAPYAYRIFAEITPELDWASVVTTSYEVLHACSAQHAVFMPPEWCMIDRDGAVTPLSEGMPQETQYGYNAMRVPWRIALDAKWYAEPRAHAYLTSFGLLRQEWSRNRWFWLGYVSDGKPWREAESLAAYGAGIGSFVFDAPIQFDEIFNEKLLRTFHEDDTQSYWEDPTNYYTQNWAWFGTALYANKLPNLWDDGHVTFSHLTK